MIHFYWDQVDTRGLILVSQLLEGHNQIFTSSFKDKPSPPKGPATQGWKTENSKENLEIGKCVEKSYQNAGLELENPERE